MKKEKKKPALVYSTQIHIDSTWSKTSVNKLIIKHIFLLLYVYFIFVLYRIERIIFKLFQLTQTYRIHTIHLLFDKRDSSTHYLLFLIFYTYLPLLYCCKPIYKYFILAQKMCVQHNFLTISL